MFYGTLREDITHPTYIMNGSVLFWSLGQRGWIQKMALALALLMACKASYTGLGLDSKKNTEGLCFLSNLEFNNYTPMFLRFS